MLREFNTFKQSVIAFTILGAAVMIVSVLTILDDTPKPSESTNLSSTTTSTMNSNSDDSESYNNNSESSNSQFYGFHIYSPESSDERSELIRKVGMFLGSGIGLTFIFGMLQTSSSCLYFRQKDTSIGRQMWHGFQKLVFLGLLISIAISKLVCVPPRTKMLHFYIVSCLDVTLLGIFLLLIKPENIHEPTRNGTRKCKDLQVSSFDLLSDEEDELLYNNDQINCTNPELK